MVKAGVTNPSVLLGVFFEALFFACLLILMAESDISFLWPLTGAELRVCDVRRDVVPARAGFLRPLGRRGVIMIGAALISYSEHAKPKPPPPAATVESGTTPP